MSKFLYLENYSNFQKETNDVTLNDLKTFKDNKTVSLVKRFWNRIGLKVESAISLVKAYSASSRAKTSDYLGGTSVEFFEGGKVSVGIYDFSKFAPKPKSNIINRVKKAYNVLRGKTNENAEADRVSLLYNVDDRDDLVHNADLEDFMIHLDNLKKPGSAPLFVYGAPGIGKTSIVNSYAKQHAMTVLRIDLSTRDATDLLGVQYPSKTEKDRADTLIPRIWPKSNYSNRVTRDKFDEDDGPGGIIFFDELNRADGLMLNATMAFIDDRGFSGIYTLPSKWYIAAAGNRTSDSDLVNELDSAVAGRFGGLINYYPEFKTWKQWALENDAVDEKILDFIADDPDDRFYTLDKNRIGYAYASPRTWERASRNYRNVMKDIEEGTKPLYKGVKGNDVRTRKFLLNAIASVIEPSLASQLVDTLMSDFGVWGDLEDVFSNPEKAGHPKQGENGHWDIDDARNFIIALAGHAQAKQRPITIDEMNNIISYIENTLKDRELGKFLLQEVLKKSKTNILNAPEVFNIFVKWQDDNINKAKDTFKDEDLSTNQPAENDKSNVTSLVTTNQDQTKEDENDIQSLKPKNTRLSYLDNFDTF